MNGTEMKNWAIGLAVFAALAGVAYVVVRGPAKVAGDAGKGAGAAVGNAATGIVKGIAESVLSAPDTNDDECTKALREGRMWDASFACPAKRFINEGVLGNSPTPATSTGWNNGIPTTSPI